MPKLILCNCEDVTQTDLRRGRRPWLSRYRVGQAVHRVRHRVLPGGRAASLRSPNGCMRTPRSRWSSSLPSRPDRRLQPTELGLYAAHRPRAHARRLEPPPRRTRRRCRRTVAVVRLPGTTATIVLGRDRRRRHPRPGAGLQPREARAGRRAGARGELPVRRSLGPQRRRRARAVEHGHQHPPGAAQPRADGWLRRRAGLQRLAAARWLPLPREERAHRRTAGAGGGVASTQRPSNRAAVGRWGTRAGPRARPHRRRRRRLEPGRRGGLSLAVHVGLRPRGRATRCPHRAFHARHGCPGRRDAGTRCRDQPRHRAL